MARRHSLPKQGTRAAIAVLSALAWMGTASASPARALSCGDNADPILEVVESALIPTNVSHEIEGTSGVSTVAPQGMSPERLFNPRAKESLRKAFADDTDRLAELAAEPVVDVSHPVKQSERTVVEAEKPTTMNTRVPGVSSEELARYKRQMYRKDI